MTHDENTAARPDDLQAVHLTLCLQCREGAGGECHTPGCSLWMNRAPDIPPRLGEGPTVVVIVGDGSEYDCGVDAGPRLAIGSLGAEVRQRWVCHDCYDQGCAVFVENYNARGHGSTFALCERCCSRRLAPGQVAT